MQIIVVQSGKAMQIIVVQSGLYVTAIATTILGIHTYMR
jgi:hypothetical protein